MLSFNIIFHVLWKFLQDVLIRMGKYGKKVNDGLMISVPPVAARYVFLAVLKTF